MATTGQTYGMLWQHGLLPDTSTRNTRGIVNILADALDAPRVTDGRDDAWVCVCRLNVRGSDPNAGSVEARSKPRCLVPWRV